MKNKKFRERHSDKIQLAFLLVIINRLIITMASFLTMGGKQITELLDLKVFRDAFYASFARFDAGWYAKIAESGYTDEKTTAFFPLYPMMMKGLSAITGFSYKVSGQAVSILFFFIALWLVQVLSEQDDILGFTMNKRQAGRFIACIIALHPLSFFYTIPYTESLFLTLTLLFMISAAQKRWLAAGICGFLAGLTRNTGALLAIIFLFQYLKSILPKCESTRLSACVGHYFREFFKLMGGFHIRYFVRYRAFLAILLIPAGSIAYFTYLYFKFGSFLGPVTSQSQFGRSDMFPLLTVYYGVQHGFDRLNMLDQFNVNDRSYFLHYYALQLLSVLFFLVAMVYLVNRLPLSYNFFMLISLLLPLSKPAYMGVVDYFVSFPRYTITLFPYFAAICGVLKGSKKALIFYLAASIYLLIMGVYFWCLGRFMA